MGIANSNSPAEPDGGALRRYRSAWSALSQLIGEGRSFSGNERNCFFLNTGNRQFVECAGTLGLDLNDDGRAVALTDWNFDGNLDLWISNRTAPRVKLLLNSHAANRRWIMLKLRGTKTNRDAIGARVALYLKGQTTPRIRTLRAGEGFLAQSSKWIHFGLRDGEQIEFVDVHWSGGSRERFENVVAGTHWELTEGTGQGRRWSPPAGFDTSPEFARNSTADVSAPASNTRTWLLGRVPLIESSYQSEQGIRSTDQFVGQPLLVNLWSRTCQPCWRELRDWTKHRDAIENSGLRIVALCVDDMTTAPTGTTFPLDKIDWPFERGQATTGFVEGLEILQRTFIELQQPLPVPSSFLLDRDGLLVSIYKGEVDTQRLLEDVKLLGKTPREQRDAAVPFQGRWASEPFASDSRVVVNALAMAGRDEDGLAYLKRYVDRVPPQNPSRDIAVEELGRQLLLGNNHEAGIETFGSLLQSSTDQAQLRRIATLLFERGHTAQSVLHFEKALSLAASSPPSRRDAQLVSSASLAHISTGNPARAAELLQEAIRLEPRNARHYYHLGNALVMAGKPEAAIGPFKKAVALKPTWALAANNLAWLLSTSPNAAIRDGELALKVLNDAKIDDSSADPSMLSTLAVAYAEANRFDQAIHCNGKAIKLIEAKQNTASARELEMLRRLRTRQGNFESAKPWRSE